MTTDLSCTIHNVSEYGSIKRNYLRGLYHLENRIDLSRHGSTSVNATEWPLINLTTNKLPIENIPSTPPPEDTFNEEAIDDQKSNLTCTPDPTTIISHRLVVGDCILGVE